MISHAERESIGRFPQPSAESKPRSICLPRRANRKSPLLRRLAPAYQLPGQTTAPERSARLASWSFIRPLLLISVPEKNEGLQVNIVL